METIHTLEKKIDDMLKTWKQHLEVESHFHARDITYQEKFDKHLEIYANNGKEMARLGEIIMELKEDMRQHIEHMEPVYEAFQGLNWSKTALLWIIGALGSAVGLILAIRELFYKR